MMRWGERAREVIAAVHRTMPPDLPLKERTAAIDAAYPFGQRELWPYEAWLKARREYLRRFGYRKRGQKSAEILLFPASED